MQSEFPGTLCAPLSRMCIRHEVLCHVYFSSAALVFDKAFTERVRWFRRRNGWWGFTIREHTGGRQGQASVERVFGWLNLSKQIFELVMGSLSRQLGRAFGCQAVELGYWCLPHIEHECITAPPAKDLYTPQLYTRRCHVHGSSHSCVWGKVFKVRQHAVVRANVAWSESARALVGSFGSQSFPVCLRGRQSPRYLQLCGWNGNVFDSGVCSLDLS